MTSRLVESMERAAARELQRRLSPGESSVTLEFAFLHRGGFAIVGGLRVVARWRSKAGRVHRFEIDAFDDSGLIASALHVRAVVVPQRLMANARRRAGRASMLLAV